MDLGLDYYHPAAMQKFTFTGMKLVVEKTCSTNTEFLPPSVTKCFQSTANKKSLRKASK